MTIYGNQELHDNDVSLTNDPSQHLKKLRRIAGENFKIKNDFSIMIENPSLHVAVEKVIC